MTRKDVALRAGVSEATVSHVLNNTKYVSTELRLRVLEAVNALGYKPNEVARSLVTKTTRHVAIVVTDIKNPYYAEITEGMQEVASKEGYLVSLVRWEDASSEQELLELSHRYIDGVFLAATRANMNDLSQKLMEQGMAVVQDIWVDYQPAIETMMDYLASLGHRHIAFLSGLALNTPGEERYPGYLRGLARNGLTVDDSLVIDGTPPYRTTIQSGYDAMNKALAAPTPPTAVFALNDLMALGAMQAIRAKGLRVPDDVSVVGCDDIYLADSVDPPLTTLRVPKLDMGRLAMNQLLQQIRERHHERASVKAELILRRSTGMARH